MKQAWNSRTKEVNLGLLGREHRFMGDYLIDRHSNGPGKQGLQEDITAKLDQGLDVDLGERDKE